MYNDVYHQLHQLPVLPPLHPPPVYSPSSHQLAADSYYAGTPSSQATSITARSSISSLAAAQSHWPSQDRALSAALKGEYLSTIQLSDPVAMLPDFHHAPPVHTLPLHSPPAMPLPQPSQQPQILQRQRSQSGRYSMQDFVFHRTLGTGSFGRVHLAQSTHNKRFYAIKVLSKEKVFKLKQVEHTNSEREMLSEVRHPFIVNLWGTFQDAKNLFMVMDFVAGGELFTLIRKSQKFPNAVAKFYAAEVALAIDYLHSINIIYRDLKPENVLIGADGHVKITDFGFSKRVLDQTWTLCGTPDYLAPEVVQSRGYTKSVDWYACGILIFEMLAGYPPFYTDTGNSNPVALYEKILLGHVNYPPHFDPLAVNIIASYLTPDLTKRLGNLQNGSGDVFAHPWFQEVDWEKLYNRDIPAPYVPKLDRDGDASQFERYDEADLSEYGTVGADKFAHLFIDFN
ncbi:hypothetical protein BOTBODRAFT_27590 [Botryobasidium botryosum FD-172 SS1]|uniref:cAMP-dependent protein kinase n=1 Tax=Botryobasidium botryosum (strain FD-172 SS1) TaxID=930990 RepID=A0A067N7S4_BOTB1|nr:hypothetical protein BOTBODRAFT_27590 [Botryobasidium botryosum FD-172 SS1]